MNETNEPSLKPSKTRGDYVNEILSRPTNINIAWRIQEYADQQTDTLQKKLADLKEESKRLKIDANNCCAYQMDRAKRDRDKAESELIRAKEQIFQIAEMAYYEGVESVDCYRGIRTGSFEEFKPKIESFLREVK